MQGVLPVLLACGSCFLATLPSCIAGRRESGRRRRSMISQLVRTVALACESWCGSGAPPVFVLSDQLCCGRYVGAAPGRQPAGFCDASISFLWCRAGMKYEIVRVDIRISIYIYMYTYIYICMHTYIRVCARETQVVLASTSSFLRFGSSCSSARRRRSRAVWGGAAGPTVAPE